MTNKEKIQSAMRHASEEEGITVAEVRRILQEAIDAGFKNPSSTAQRLLQAIPHEGEYPDVDEFFSAFLDTLKD